jgi:hypothetical protein
LEFRYVHRWWPDLVAGRFCAHLKMMAFSYYMLCILIFCCCLHVCMYLVSQGLGYFFFWFSSFSCDGGYHMQYCVDPLARMKAALKNNPTSLKFHAKYKYEMVSPSYFQINEIRFLQKKKSKIYNKRRNNFLTSLV